MKKAGTTEATIIQLGTELIQSRGVNGFSFADIAKAMDIKKASIHYYFPSKTDLIAKVLEDYQQDFEQNLQDIKENNDSLFQRLVEFTGLYRRDLEEGCLSLPVMLLAEGQSLSEDIQQSVREFFQLNIAWLETVFAAQGVPTQKAKDFYASIQGLQLLSQASKNVDDFDQLMVDKIITIQK